MNYLMTFDKIKRALKVSKKKGPFAIAAGTLGAVYPVLVDPNADYATTLRIKYNNEIKAFASTPSIILGKSFVAKTGSLLEDCKTFPSVDKLSFTKIIYDKFTGSYLAFGIDDHSALRNITVKSDDGKNWYITRTIESNAQATDHGVLESYIEQVEKYDKRGNIESYDYYNIVRLHRGDDVIVLAREFLANFSIYSDPDFYEECYIKALPNTITTDITTSDNVVYHNIDTTVVFVSFGYKPYDPTTHSTGWGKAYFYHLANPSTDKEDIIFNPVYNKNGGAGASHILYNYNLKLCGTPFYDAYERLYTYDGKNFIKESDLPFTYRPSDGYINGYDIFYEQEVGGGCYLSADGINNTLYSTKIICGYDPVDNTYIHQFKYIKHVGPIVEYKVLLDIYTSTDLQTWNLVKQFDYGQTERWVPEDVTSAVDTYYVMGFTNT